MMELKKIRVEKIGSREITTKFGQRLKLWLKGSDGKYYEKFVTNKEKARSFLTKEGHQLDEGDKVRLSYYVKEKNGYTNNVIKDWWLLVDEEAQKKPSENQAGRGLPNKYRELSEEEEEHYRYMLAKARDIVKAEFPPDGYGLEWRARMTAAVFDKIATPLVYLRKEMGRE